MSEENVAAFKRGLTAYNRRDAEALLEDLDPDVEWHPALLVMLGGQATVYRGHEGVREMLRETDDVLAEIHAEFSEIRDPGDQVVAIGRIRTRGKASGAVTESPLGYVADFRNGKVSRIRTYLDPQEALKAAGSSE
ncbi:MAG: nuclear transport factor 2 family protein [Solirubrobacterales bacterium]